MLEIILLIFLARSIGAKALLKGQPKGRWQFYTVMAWIAFELLGAVVGYAISQNLITTMLLAIASAFGGYLLVRYRLEQYPDVNDGIEEWMSRIGRDDEGR